MQQNYMGDFSLFNLPELFGDIAEDMDAPDGIHPSILASRMAIPSPKLEPSTESSVKTFFKFPPEIIQQIAGKLDNITRPCFVVSCKAIFKTVGTASFSFSGESKVNSARSEFLKRLSTSIPGQTYCEHCSIIHDSQSVGSRKDGICDKYLQGVEPFNSRTPEFAMVLKSAMDNYYGSNYKDQLKALEWSKSEQSQHVLHTQRGEARISTGRAIFRIRDEYRFEGKSRLEVQNMHNSEAPWARRVVLCPHHRGTHNHGWSRSVQWEGRIAGDMISRSQNGIHQIGCYRCTGEYELSVRGFGGPKPGTTLVITRFIGLNGAKDEDTTDWFPPKLTGLRRLRTAFNRYEELNTIYRKYLPTPETRVIPARLYTRVDFQEEDEEYYEYFDACSCPYRRPSGPTYTGIDPSIVDQIFGKNIYEDVGKRIYKYTLWRQGREKKGLATAIDLYCR